MIKNTKSLFFAVALLGLTAYQNSQAENVRNLIAKAVKSNKFAQQSAANAKSATQAAYSAASAKLSSAQDDMDQAKAVAAIASNAHSSINSEVDVHQGMIVKTVIRPVNQEVIAAE